LDAVRESREEKERERERLKMLIRGEELSPLGTVGCGCFWVDVRREEKH